MVSVLVLFSLRWCGFAIHTSPDMATTLMRFDNNANGIEYYKALAWKGLRYTYGWQIKTQAEIDAINAMVNEINSGS